MTGKRGVLNISCVALAIGGTDTIIYSDRSMSFPEDWSSV